jgi:poly(hydroxyalkanoate) depolymerase family esterase
LPTTEADLGSERGCLIGSPALKAKYMPNILNKGLLEATCLTHVGQLTAATAALQRSLRGDQLASSGMPAATTPAIQRVPPTLDGVAEPGGTTEAPSTRHAEPPAPRAARPFFNLPAGVVPALPKGVRGFIGFQPPEGGANGLSPMTPRPVPDGAQFLAASFSNEAGSRPYKLYVPSGYYPGRPTPLVVMLHGCTQSPDDFAAGTCMNVVAEQHTCLVVYPGQTASANVQRCWNWFSEGDQHRDRGEPALIAGITREIMRNYAIDPRQVYVAGLSAGGAVAAIMGDAYPDLYAAIGVHSGLACGAARDMPSAFAAMQGAAHRVARTARSGRQQHIVPVIVFHGDRDATVNLRNAEAVVAQSAGVAALTRHTVAGQILGGHAFSRTLHATADGQTVIEQWVVHGAGHAWFGGSPAGSYTDPRGPDATREMLRFFLEHPHPAPAA